MTSTTSRSVARSRTLAARVRSRPRRSTSWATSVAAGCCSRSAWRARSSSRVARGRARSIDAAMVDGAATLMTMMWGFQALGIWGEFGTNVLDTGAPFYDTYETSDGKFISLGSLEPQFYAELLARTGLTDEVDAGPADGPVVVAGAAGEVHRAVQDQDARRVGLDPRDDRRLLRAGADDARGRRSTRTSRRGARSSRTTGCPSPRPRRGSAVRPARSPVRPRGPASTPTRCSPTGASPRTRSPSSASPAPSSNRLPTKGWRRVRRGGEGGAEPARRASSSVGSSAVTVMWPTLRPGRVALP